MQQKNNDPAHSLWSDSLSWLRNHMPEADARQVLRILAENHPGTTSSLANVGDAMMAAAKVPPRSVPIPLGPRLPRTHRPDSRQRAFLVDQLAQRQLPTAQISKLEFVEGLDDNANFLTKLSFPKAEAVTQGNTIYVQPGKKFDEVANFRSAIPFEEVYHSAKFSDEGRNRFYPHYVTSSVGGILAGLGDYSGNIEEAFASGASKAMFENYQRSLAKAAATPKSSARKGLRK